LDTIDDDNNQSYARNMSMTDQDKIERRKQQLRDAQRKRREALSVNGSRQQVNIFLSRTAKKILDTTCEASGLDRHQFIEKLILEIKQNRK